MHWLWEKKRNSRFFRENARCFTCTSFLHLKVESPGLDMNSATEPTSERFALLDDSPIGHFVLESDFTVLFWNRCLEAWTGIPRERIVGESIIHHFPHLGGDKYANRIRSMFGGGPPTIFSSQLHKHLIPAALPGGKSRFQYTVVTAIPDFAGSGCYALFSIQDVTSLTEAIESNRISYEQAQAEMAERRKAEIKLVKYTQELKRLNKALKEQAIRDGLTGLFNQRHFYLTLRRDFLLSGRNGQPLSCLLLDLDYFKTINDLHGHQVGDKVLKIIAVRIRKSVRQTDVVSRYGGEEFAVLLPATNLAGALVIANKIRAAIERQPFTHNTLAIRITVSIGVSCTVSHMPPEPEDLLAYADKALYVAKAAGRNSVRSYSAENGIPAPTELLPGSAPA